MTVTCEFTAPPGSTSHTITELSFKNECLRQQVMELKTKLKSMSDTVDTQNETIAAIQSRIDEIKDHYSSSMSQHSEQVTLKLLHQEKLFDAAVGVYENWSVGFSMLLALAGIVTFVFIKQYKTREVNEVVDQAIQKLNKQVEDEGLLISAVVNSFDSEQVKNKVKSIENEMQDRQEIFVRSILDERIDSNDLAIFRNVVEDENGDENGDDGEQK